MGASPAALALRLTALVTPLFLGACAVPSGGLFRGAKFRDLHLYRQFGDGLLDGRLPYRDVFVEYPPGAIPLFTAPSLAPGVAYDALFKTLMVACGLAAIFCVVLMLVRTGASLAWATGAAVFLAVVPIALGPVSLNTYDAWPALLVVAALAAVTAGRSGLAGGLLGAAFAAKLYPIVVLPAVLVYAGGVGARRLAAWFAGVTGMLVIPWVALSPGGVWESLDAQLGRGLHAESLGGSLLLAADRAGWYSATVVRTAPAVSRDLAGPLADGLATASSVLALAAAALAGLAFARGPATPVRLGWSFGAAVAGFLAFTKVLSPQYLVWLVPLVPLAGGGLGLAAAAALVAALALAQSWYFDYPELWAGGPQAWSLLARNLLLVALYGVLLRKTTMPSREKTSVQSGFWRRRASAAAAGIGATRSP